MNKNMKLLNSYDANDATFLYVIDLHDPDHEWYYLLCYEDGYEFVINHDS